MLTISGHTPSRMDYQHTTFRCIVIHRKRKPFGPLFFSYCVFLPCSLQQMFHIWQPKPNCAGGCFVRLPPSTPVVKSIPSNYDYTEWAKHAEAMLIMGLSEVKPRISQKASKGVTKTAKVQLSISHSKCCLLRADPFSVCAVIA